MSRSRRTLALVGAALLGLSLSSVSVAGAAPKDDPGAKARAEHERIVAYWTPERMKAAKPRDFERLPDGSFRQVRPAKRGDSSRGKPGTGGGGGTNCTGEVPTTSGASWDCGGDVKKLTGKVLFTMGGVDYICSGAVAEDGDGAADTAKRSLVMTAGHCVWDQGGQEFANNLMFYPDFDSKATYSCGDSAYGCWTAVALVAHSDFTTQKRFNEAAITHDFAFAVVGLGGNGTAADLDTKVGGEYEVGTSESVFPATSFGYPAARPYSGYDLVYCDGTPFADPGTTGATWGLSCNMTGGASGGPWFTGITWDGMGGVLKSLNSYRYQGQKDYMYGPKFTQDTLSVWQVAKSVASGLSTSSSGTVVVGTLP